MLYAKPCCAVDPIENEEDRKKVKLYIYIYILFIYILIIRFTKAPISMMAIKNIYFSRL